MRATTPRGVRSISIRASSSTLSSPTESATKPYVSPFVVRRHAHLFHELAHDDKATPPQRVALLPTPGAEIAHLDRHLPLLRPRRDAERSVGGTVGVPDGVCGGPAPGEHPVLSPPPPRPRPCPP